MNKNHRRFQKSSTGTIVSNELLHNNTEPSLIIRERICFPTINISNSAHESKTLNETCIQDYFTIGDNYVDAEYEFINNI